VWADVLTFLDGYYGDAANCNVYWLKKHSIDAGASTVPATHEGIIALGAAAFAISSQAQYQVDMANTGGQKVNKDYNFWAKAMFDQFYTALERIRSYNPRRLKTTEMTTEE